MRAPFNRPTKAVTETVHGVDVTYDVPDNTPVIRLPFNLDAALRRILFGIAIAMTLGAIVWGTVAIGSMLTLLAPPWGAYLVAGIFDAGWAGCLIAEWVLRYDHARARVPAAVGLAMLLVSVAAIIIDGVRADAVAIGIIGALVSAAAKGMWAVAMYTIRIKLDPKYEAYLRTQQQRAGTEQALALGERDRLLTGDRTVKLRLALEARRGAEPVVNQAMDQAAERMVEQPQSEPVQAPEQRVDQIETTPEPAPVQAVNQTPNRSVQSVQPEDQVTVLLSRLRDGESISKSKAAKILGVSESTAWRRLTAAQTLLRQYN